MDTVKFKVSGMTCGHCQMAVKKALESIEGVKSATVDLEKGMATVEADTSMVSTGQMIEAIDEAGYQAVLAD